MVWRRNNLQPMFNGKRIREAAITRQVEAQCCRSTSHWGLWEVECKSLNWAAWRCFFPAVFFRANSGMKAGGCRLEPRSGRHAAVENQRPNAHQQSHGRSRYHRNCAICVSAWVGLSCLTAPGVERSGCEGNTRRTAAWKQAESTASVC